MLVNLNTDINLTDILQVTVSIESVLRSFYMLTIWVFIFWRKENRAGAASKMLVKLTTERHFNVEECRCKFDKRRSTRDDV